LTCVVVVVTVQTMARIIKRDVETRRLLRVEYDRLVASGLFTGERIELLDGLLVVCEPQATSHTTAVRCVQRALSSVFGEGWEVRAQLPLALDENSEPEPDVVVVRLSTRDNAAPHPACALVVEVADGSLRVDRGPKAMLYARAGIADYWIVNLQARALEIYRSPCWSRMQGAAQYVQSRAVRPPAGVTPLAAPSARIAVADLLPAATTRARASARRPAGRSRTTRPSSPS
jgi:Uma2 family endonuclease